MRVTVAIILAGLALAGCGKSEGDDVASPAISIETKEGGTVQAADGKLAIDVPGFDAKLSIPSFTLSGEQMDIDGIAPPPTTTITGIDIREDEAGATGKGAVTMRFTDTQPPAALVAHYRATAAKNGYAVADAPGGLVLTRDDKRVTLRVEPKGAGSAGSVAIGDA